MADDDNPKELSTLKELMAMTPELSMTDITYIQDWMKKQPHLPTITDRQVVPFLHSCYYSLERTKTTIENYFTMRTHATELFRNCDLSQSVLQANLELFIVGVLSKRDANGNVIICTHMVNPDTTTFVFTESLKLILMMIDIIIEHNPTAPGYVFVMDMENVTMSHVTKTSLHLATVKKVLMYIQEAFPMRMKAINVINCTALMDTIMTMIRPFLNRELVELIQFHPKSSMEKLYEVVPRDILPVDFGGELGSLQKIYSKIVAT